jgi:hypothetical protein
MTDPRSDITSKQGSSGWHIALDRAVRDRAGQVAYLGDLPTVSSMVRLFIAGVTDRYSEVAEGNLFPAQAAEADREACNVMALAFTGQSPGYQPAGPWNTDGGLANHVRAVLKDYLAAEALTDDTAAVAQTFAVLAHQVYGVIGKLAEDGDEDDARLSLEALAEDWTHLMLGITPVEDEPT